ncbi:hypothetical protein [Xylophilus sp. GOD-11R]|uniref:hypothetical protein n=1 Tax=Xylophilus sp. GOD-11R TaxID=3089814 RepID=UPI00298C56C2|nr:hypothetical protein [Xylophilus sp. GOD-11R]WPB56592.1 hypothetical protein R9X41_21015 [Xylophilus sp. GOD-11R]
MRHVFCTSTEKVSRQWQGLDAEQRSEQQEQQERQVRGSAAAKRNHGPRLIDE